MRVNLTNGVLNIKVKQFAEAVSTINFNLKEKIEFLEADEFEIEIIMNAKICKMLLFNLSDFESVDDDVIILMRELFDEDITLEELKQINNKLIRAYEKQIDEIL